jgi:hypothetical protein
MYAPARHAWSLPEREPAPLLLAADLPDHARLLTLELRGAIESTATVSSLDSVSTLSRAPGLTFIHKGRVLCPALSFAFLRIGDGDEIFAVARGAPARAPAKAAERLSEQTVARLRQRFDAKFSARFRDPEAVFEQFRDATDPVTARESARLGDLFRMRMDEGARPRAFARPRERGQRRQRAALATVLPEKPAGPSTALLPEMRPSRRAGSSRAI